MESRVKATNRALRAARRTGFWKPNRWTKDEVFETAAVILAFAVGFVAIGLWLVDFCRGG
jgi:hypothetical protein